LVPLHPRLIELGLLEYVEARRQEGSLYLFPDLDHSGVHEPTKALSQWYGRFLRRIGITDRRKVFHSFRHGMKTMLRLPGIGRDISDAITGHTRDGVSGAYGSSPPLDVMHDILRKLRLSCIDNLVRPAVPVIVPARKAGATRRRPRRNGRGEAQVDQVSRPQPTRKGRSSARRSM
jgi:integrase